MTKIEKKALALLNECADQEVYGGWTTFDPNQTPCTRALCRAIEQNEALQAEVERLKDQLSVETEPSPYCPICGSCGDEGCCGSKRCMYPDTGIEALRLAVVHYDAALKSSWPYGAKGDAWEHWNEARIILQDAGQPWLRTYDAHLKADEKGRQ